MLNSTVGFFGFTRQPVSQSGTSHRSSKFAFIDVSLAPLFPMLSVAENDYSKNYLRLEWFTKGT